MHGSSDGVLGKENNFVERSFDNGIIGGEPTFSYTCFSWFWRKSTFWCEFAGVEDYWELTEVSSETEHYYRSCFERGIQPLIYHTVPQVLILGEVRISEYEIISTS